MVVPPGVIRRRIRGESDRQHHSDDKRTCGRHSGHEEFLPVNSGSAKSCPSVPIDDQPGVGALQAQCSAVSEAHRSQFRRDQLNVRRVSAQAWRKPSLCRPSRSRPRFAAVVGYDQYRRKPHQPHASRQTPRETLRRRQIGRRDGTPSVWRSSDYGTQDVVPATVSRVFGAFATGRTPSDRGHGSARGSRRPATCWCARSRKCGRHGSPGRTRRTPRLRFPCLERWRGYQRHRSRL